MTLAEVQGQEEGVKSLRRVVEGKFTSPLLLVGTEGTGRRFAVTQAIKEMFCSGSKQSDCACPDCTQVTYGVHPDLLTISAEAKDIGIDAVREAIERSTSYPVAAPVRVFLVDGVDQITTAAANAILKTLEEPPSTTRFFLLAESLSRVLPTIQSRCGLVHFRPLPEDFILSVLHQHCSDRGKALVYCRLSEGSVGQAVRLWSSSRLSLRDKIFTLLVYGLKKDVPSLFSAIDALGKDLLLGLQFFELLLLDLAMIQHDPSRVINQDLIEKLSAVRAKLQVPTWRYLVDGLRQVRGAYHNTHISLPFHVKALFVSAFSRAS